MHHTKSTSTFYSLKKFLIGQSPEKYQKGKIKTIQFKGQIELELISSA